MRPGFKLLILLLTLPLGFALTIIREPELRTLLSVIPFSEDLGLLHNGRTQRVYVINDSTNSLFGGVSRVTSLFRASENVYAISSNSIVQIVTDGAKRIHQSSARLMYVTNSNDFVLVEGLGIAPKRGFLSLVELAGGHTRWTIEYDAERAWLIGDRLYAVQFQLEDDLEVLTKCSLTCHSVVDGAVLWRKAMRVRESQATRLSLTQVGKTLWIFDPPSGIQMDSANGAVLSKATLPESEIREIIITDRGVYLLLYSSTGDPLTGSASSCTIVYFVNSASLSHHGTIPATFGRAIAFDRGRCLLELVHTEPRDIKRPDRVWSGTVTCLNLETLKIEWEKRGSYLGHSATSIWTAVQNKNRKAVDIWAHRLKESESKIVGSF